MQPDVLYYRVIAYIVLPNGNRFARVAFISSPVSLNFSNSEGRDLAMTRFVQNYEGPTIESRFWATAPSRTMSTFAHEWFEKKLRNSLKPKKVGPNVLQITIDLRTCSVFAGKSIDV